MEGFGLGLLPLQVRLCENKLGIIKRVLEECPDAYKQSEKVIGALKREEQGEGLFVNNYY